MNILNKNVQDLSNAISVTLDNVRLAVYAGVAYGYIETCRESIISDNASDIKIKLYDLYYELNEVAVIDKNMFMDICNKFVNFTRAPMVCDTLITSFDDMIGITNVFGKATVDAINVNINDFRNARSLIKKCLAEKGN